MLNNIRIMNNKDFYKLYLKALEIALSQDHINYGFHTKGPDFFIEDNHLSKVDNYINLRCDDNMNFIDSVGYYFDAKSHNFSNIQGVDINIYRLHIVEGIKDLKLKYGL